VKLVTANVPTGPGSCATPMPAVNFYGASKTQLRWRATAASSSTAAPDTC
jgi:hypothetical protein